VKIKTDIVDHLVVILLLIIVWFSIAAIKTAHAHGHRVIEKHVVSESNGPDIPRCDKELWLRIKDGCNE